MKKILLGTTLLFGLAGPTFATGLNTISIDNSAGSVQTLAIDQDAAAGNTVSANGLTGGSATALAISGPWNSVAITQAGAGNTLKGTSIISHSGSTTAALSTSYTTTDTGANVHQLNIGGTTAPTNASVTVTVTNTGSTDNTITDTLNGNALTYNLGLSGTGNTLTNAVKATGGVTLTQGGGGHGITGDSNTISNSIGQSTAVTSFSQALTVTGDSNSISNTVDSGGAKVVNQSVTGDSNVIATTVAGGGAQTANLGLTGTFVDYGITSAANGSYADVSLSGVGGASGVLPDVVRVEQTSAASGATAILTVAGGGNTMGTLGAVTGTYSADSRLAGVSVYQNSSGAYLNVSVTGTSNGYTAVFKQ